MKNISDFRHLYVQAATRHAIYYLRYSLQEALNRARFIETLEEELDHLLINPTSLRIQEDDLNRLEMELPNTLRGIDWLFQDKQWNVVIGVIQAISDLLYLGGYLDKALDLGELAVEAAKNAQDDWSLAEITYTLSFLFTIKGDYPKAQQYCGSCLTEFKNLDDRLGAARALYQLGVIAHYLGEYDKGQEQYQASLAAFKLLKDKQGVASCLHGLGTINFSLGEYAEAERLYEASLKLKKELEDQRSLAHVLHQLANIAYSQGNLEEALQRCEEALEIKHNLGYVSGIARSLFQLGVISQAQGDFTKATDFYRQSIEIRKQVGDSKGLAIVLERMGCMAEDLNESRQVLLSAVELNQTQGNQMLLACNLYNLALVLERQGNYNDAQDFYSEALSIFNEVGSYHLATVREAFRRTKLWVTSELDLKSSTFDK